MKTQLFLLTVVTLSILTTNCQHQKKELVNLNQLSFQDKTDTISYALGITWAHNMKEVDLKTISYNGFYDGVRSYLAADTAFMGIHQASGFLAKNTDTLKNLETKKSAHIHLQTRNFQSTTKLDSFSYALGFSWCRGAYSNGIDTINPFVMKGIQDGFSAIDTVFTKKTAKSYLTAYMEQRMETEYAGVKNMNAHWLEQNQQKDGVITLDNGLQYKVLKPGTGDPVSANAIVEYNYIAKLIHGTTFENTYLNDEPQKAILSALNEGMAQALRLMKEGAKWEVYVPHHLAYGSGGLKDLVPPFSTIIYELELIEVTAPTKKK